MWNFDMTAAPKDRDILILTNSGTRTISKWLETLRNIGVIGHWTNIHDAEFPVAWCDMPAVPARYAEGL